MIPLLLAALLVQGPLADLLRWEPEDAARMEKRLARAPEDSTARLQVMAYYARADRLANPQDRENRFRHTLWLIQHHPESDILHSYVSHFNAGDLTAAQRDRAVALWAAAVKAHPGNAGIFWNAASFFRGLDDPLYLTYLEATAAADPNHPEALRPLAHRYALDLLSGGPAAEHARRALEVSRNVWVLGNAAYMLQSQYNLSRQMGKANPRAAEWAERYYLRAKALSPDLDRDKILPTLEKAPPPAPVRAAAFKPIRRLPVEAFPQLPRAVASVLRERRCTVPQPSDNGARNVIQGEFFAPGQRGWAVLCAEGKSTSLLAFRGDDDTRPVVINRRDDQQYVQDGSYSREITAAGLDFIIGHYRAYGGPPPPPITHQGIDDAFLEKASVTWYFHQGKWMPLQGAD
jgi:tetratricopeptide (TPR) repeat protein